MYAYKGPKLWAIVNKGNHAVALDLKYPGQTCNFLRRGIIKILLARDKGLSEIPRNDYNNRQELGYKHNRNCTVYRCSLGLKGTYYMQHLVTLGAPLFASLRRNIFFCFHQWFYLQRYIPIPSVPIQNIIQSPFKYTCTVYLL